MGQETEHLSLKEDELQAVVDALPESKLRDRFCSALVSARSRREFLDTMFKPRIPPNNHGHPEGLFCYGVEDGLDGFCVHAPGCRSYGQTWTGPNSDCVRV